jgi:hypothetical protein
VVATLRHIHWANFDRLVPLLAPDQRDEAFRDLAIAEHSQPTIRKPLIAERIIASLENQAPRAVDLQQLLELPSGKLFAYTGSAGASGMRSPRDQDGEARGAIRVPRRSSRRQPQLRGDARLAHTITSSVTEVGKVGEVYIFGIKLEPFTFRPLAIGTATASTFEEQVESEPYATTPTRGPDDFIERVVDSLTHIVERGHGWRLIHDDDGVPRREASVQALFEACCDAHIGSADLSIDPEANHGDGRVDICVSHGRVASCIELKRASNSKIIHGLTHQLPAYMSSKRAVSGWYIVVMQDGCVGDTATLRNQLEDLVDSDQRIRVRVIDGRPRAGASV